MVYQGVADEPGIKSSGSQVAKSNEKGAVLPPSRIVVLVLAIAVGVVFYRDYQVRSGLEESESRWATKCRPTRPRRPR